MHESSATVEIIPHCSTRTLQNLIELLKTPAFLEKLILLLLTAALTGVLVPAISGRIAASRLKEEKIFDAEIQRQRDILSAQSELLKKLSKLFWEFQLMNIDVSFYRINGNKGGYRTAIGKYQGKAAETLGQMRAELSSSRRLTSPLMQSKLSTLYFGTLLPIDASLEQLIQKGSSATLSECNQQHESSFVGAQKAIDDLLTELAFELKLTDASAQAGHLAGPSPE